MEFFREALKNQFFYEQGVDLFLALITFLALLVTLGNIIYTNHKLSINKKEEEQKVEDLLRILSIITKFFIDDLNRLTKNIMNSRMKEQNHFYHLVSDKDAQFIYQENEKLKYYYTVIYEMKELKIQNNIRIFIKKIEHFLNTQNLNFNSNSLDKISNLLQIAEELKNLLDDHIESLEVIFDIVIKSNKSEKKVVFK